jgi:hypothetical protein
MFSNEVPNFFKSRSINIVRKYYSSDKNFLHLLTSPVEISLHTRYFTCYILIAKSVLFQQVSTGHRCIIRCHKSGGKRSQTQKHSATAIQSPKAHAPTAQHWPVTSANQGWTIPEQNYLAKGNQNYLAKADQNYLAKGEQNYLAKGEQNYLAKGEQNYLAKGEQNYLAKGEQNYFAKGDQNYPAKGQNPPALSTAQKYSSAKRPAS